jgi:signal transduction histidine kinase
MKARRPKLQLSLHKWLGIALITIIVVPFGVTAISAFHIFGNNPDHIVNLAVARLRSGSAQWQDPSWQEATKKELARDNIDFVLMDGNDEIYRSTAQPIGDADGNMRQVRVLEIAGGTSQYAYVYSPAYEGPPPEIRNWLVAGIGSTVLILTLAGVAWFFTRAVDNPLGEASRAAKRIGEGDFDVSLPTSRVREVAEVNAAFVAMSDALKTSLQEQSKMEQQRRLFIGAVVHDLRTPLFSLRGYLEGFEKGLADTPEKQNRYIATAREKAAALDRLVGDLFDFTRLEYLEQAPKRETLDFCRLLRRSSEGMKPQAEAKAISISVDAETSVSVEGDPHLLNRAVGNLLDNALRYTPHGGHVAVTCAVDGNRVNFSVADSGPGIPSADLPHLFTPLFRGETSRNRRTGGAGLGLTIARSILIAHGGDLSARNGPQSGAIFTGHMLRTIPASSRTGDGEPDSVDVDRATKTAVEPSVSPV